MRGEVSPARNAGGGRPQAKGTRAFEDVLEGLSVPFLAHMKEHKILYRSH